MSARDQTGVDPGPENLEIPAEPSATDDRPEWLDPKFESPEDQAKAYAEAQREMSRAQERARQAEQRVEEWAAQQQQYQPEPEPQQSQYDPGSLSAIYQEAVENGDARTMFGVHTLLSQQAVEEKFGEFQKQMQQQFAPNPIDQQQNAQMFAVMAEQQTAAKYGEEWEALKPAVGEILQDHPHLLPENGTLDQTVNALSLVAEMARARTVGATAQAAVDAGRQQKRLAQGLSGGSGRPDTQQINAADHLADLMKNIR